MKVLIEYNGKKVEKEISRKQAESLGLIENITGWERVEKGEKYYISEAGNSSGLGQNDEEDDEIDQIYYDNANYYSTRNKAEQVNKILTLWRKMQRFADENNEGGIDWENFNTAKYFITYECRRRNFEIIAYFRTNEPFEIYFTSREIAEKALEIFGEELKEVLGIIN